MTLNSRTPKTVRCPVCRKTRREYVNEAGYRQYVTTRFDYPPMTCDGCLGIDRTGVADGPPPIAPPPPRKPRAGGGTVADHGSGP